MNRFPTLFLIAGLVLLVAGCAIPGSDQTQLEFERLRERTTTPEEDKILPDFGTDSWTEEAVRPFHGSLDRSPLV